MNSASTGVRFVGCVDDAIKPLLSYSMCLPLLSFTYTESCLTHVFCGCWDYLIVRVLLVTSVATEPVRYSLLRDIINY